MPQISLELHPLRPAVAADAPTTVDLLLRVVPPAFNSAMAQRPPLNIALVLDRSGSMGGDKLDYARQAAVYAVEQLLPTDRVSVTVFDDAVDTLVPSTPAEQKRRVIERIAAIQTGGSTALHDGWSAGAGQVREHLIPEGLNRVLLLTDGLANVGETNPDTIATDVKRQSLAGVSTTTLGLGRDYNEDLLEAMARSGDGNYYFIESPRQLPDIFQTELRGLMATVGRSLALETRPAEGVRVADVLNELNRDAQGRLILPTLVLGMPIEVVLRLSMAPPAAGRDLITFRLTYIDPKEGPQELSATLTLPAVPLAEYETLPADPRVAEQVALHMAARAKREATHRMEAGDMTGTWTYLDQARQALAGLAATEAVAHELREQAELADRLRDGDVATSAKMAKAQRYRRSHSRPQPPTDPQP